MQELVAPAPTRLLKTTQLLLLTWMLVPRKHPRRGRLRETEQRWGRGTQEGRLWGPGEGLWEAEA